MSKNETTRRANSKSADKRTQAAAKVAQSGMIRARISPELKVAAESILDQIGLTSSDAIRMFYKQITLRKGLPFEARIPNATTRKALRDAEAGRNLTRHADDLFSNKQKTDQNRIKALEELSALDHELGLG